jgi:hypothetical protein
MAEGETQESPAPSAPPPAPRAYSEAYVRSLQVEIDDLRTRLHEAECAARRVEPATSREARLKRVISNLQEKVILLRRALESECSARGC